MNTYIVTVQHDYGKTRIQTDATSARAARDAVIKSENCPPSAILSVMLVKAGRIIQSEQDLAYELARHIGDSRYGSQCRHTRTHNGRCLDCQRKVV